ncbi:FAD-dependent oxidoreductase [Patescibacteria group bacterium]|nr:FAD-dependent oxidoreductase [Patescibacteria group bacterium]
MDYIYDVIIVGAGPAGLFAAYELTKQNPTLNICMIEKGNLIRERKSSEIMCGVGGAGAFSDGKLHFTPVLSHEKMLHLYSADEYQKYLDYTDKILTDFGVDAKYYPTDMEAVQELVDEAKKKAIKLFVRKARHVGSDKLPKIIENFEDFIVSHGVEIKPNLEVVDVIVEDRKIKGVRTVGGTEIFARYVIMAPGRINARWLQKLAERFKLNFSYEKVEIGVRVEFSEAVLKKHADLMYETVFMMQTPTFDDAVRTFCPCPRGMVASEQYEDFICVNGHSTSEHNSENSNFAFVSEVILTEPIENTIAYGKSIAKLATTLGGGKPIIQRLADLRKGRRSTWDRIKKSFVRPTLLEATPGDIAMALPYRVVSNVIEGLDMLDSILPGLASGHTLLYAPEIKLRSSKITTDKYLQTEIQGLYVAGDGAGVSGNITGAAVTGLICAHGILNN